MDGSQADLSHAALCRQTGDAERVTNCGTRQREAHSSFAVGPPFHGCSSLLSAAVDLIAPGRGIQRFSHRPKKQ
jgi:hypothetical protein